MKLRQAYSDRVYFFFLGLLMLFGAVAAAYMAATRHLDWFNLLLLGGLVLAGLAMARPLMRRAMLPFRVDVDSRGWSIRTPKLNQDLRWDEIAAVVLADAPEEVQQRPVPLRSRLLLVPAAGVSLGVPLTEESPVDGRAAVELFRLSDVDYSETRLVRQLAVLAGERFHNSCSYLTWPGDGISLRRFPDEPDHARLMFWLDWRGLLLFVGWYLFVLVPSLLLVGIAAQRNELLGVGVLIAGASLVVAVARRAWHFFGDCRVLAEQEIAVIDGSDLVTGFGLVQRRTSLHAGSVNVLRPGTLKGHGKAWLLAEPGDDGSEVPELLLSDPRTGQLRTEEDLRALAAVLGASSHESDRAAGRQLEELAARAPVVETSPSADEWNDPPAVTYVYDLWSAVQGLGRAVVLLGLPVAVATVGGWAEDEGAAFVGIVLIIAAVCLGAVWLMYALYRILEFLGALLGVASRATRLSS
ncbi:hypothetical protein ACWDV4_23880 [Micromonospora sp. NPDC003197]